MAEGQYTPAEFAAKIKAQYPQYANTDDSVLVSKILKKYPEYASSISATPKPNSFLEVNPIVSTNISSPKQPQEKSVQLNRQAVDGTTVAKQIRSCNAAR